MSKVENALANLNADELSKVLSDNVTIIINASIQGQTQVMKPSKQEYIAMMQQEWSMCKNYKYSDSNVKFKIQDNKAFVSAAVRESMTVQGRNVAIESKEEITIELINGKPLITNVVIQFCNSHNRVKGNI